MYCESNLPITAKHCLNHCDWLTVKKITLPDAKYDKVDIFWHIWRKKFINQLLGVNIRYITCELGGEIAGLYMFSATRWLNFTARRIFDSARHQQT